MYFSETEFIKIESTIENETTTSEKIALSSKGNIVLSDNFHAFLSNNIKHSEYIKHLNSTVNFTGKHQLPAQITQEKSFASITNNTMTFNIQSDIDFNNLAFQSMQLNSAFTIATNSDLLSIDITSTKDTQVTLRPQENSNTFKASKNTRFLAKKPIYLNIPKTISVYIKRKYLFLSPRAAALNGHLLATPPLSTLISKI